MLKCQNCGKYFPYKIKIKGRIWNLASRKFCPDCSSLGENNRKQYIVNVSDGKSFCIYCKKEKLNDFFYKRNNGSSLSYCKECLEITKNLKFEEKLENIITTMGAVCFDCQQSFPSKVFRFWKNNRIFPISKLKSMSWKRIIDKLVGYEILCLNCAEIRKWKNAK